VPSELGREGHGGSQCVDEGGFDAGRAVSGDGCREATDQSISRRPTYMVISLDVLTATPNGHRLPPERTLHHRYSAPPSLSLAHAQRAQALHVVRADSVFAYPVGVPDIKITICKLLNGSTTSLLVRLSDFGFEFWPFLPRRRPPLRRDFAQWGMLVHLQMRR
jgi:hypothetical protein